MSEEQDKIFFRNYSVVIGILALAMLVFFIIAQNVGGNKDMMTEQQAQRESESAEKMMKDTAPVGEVSVAGEADAEAAPAAEEMAAAGPKSGEEVYNGICVACHSVPGIGAPVVGDTEQWAARIAKGNDTLYANAINGFVGESGMMPARGGGQYTDEEVKAAVDYMVSKSQ